MKRIQTPISDDVINDLKVGDEIIIHGAPFTYSNGTKEFSNGTYCYSINGTLTE